MGKIAGGQHSSAEITNGCSSAVVHIGRRVVAEARVPVLIVVPREEALAEEARILLAAEAIRKVRPVLKGLELRLAVRVVVRAVRARVGLDDAQVGEQQRYRLQVNRKAGARKPSPLGPFRPSSADKAARLNGASDGDRRPSPARPVASIAVERRGTMDPGWRAGIQRIVPCAPIETEARRPRPPRSGRRGARGH
jgi:hypothetical protein